MIPDFVIVGSGINSLVCAALLARKGYRVRVLERNDRAGGCIRTEECTLPGFVHDVLSCWHPLFVTSPGYAELKPELERHGLRYCNTDAPTAVLLPDGRHFILRTSREKNIQAMNALCAGDGDRYATATAALEGQLDLTFAVLGPNLWSWGTVRTFAAHAWRHGAGAVLEFARHGLQAAHPWLETTFGSDLLRACFAPWTLHAGVGPDNAGSAVMAQIIPWTLEAVGSPVVAGGGEGLVRALRQIIESHGGEIVLNADATRITVRDGVARGVVTATGVEHAAARGVICSVTPGQLYGRLLPPELVQPPVAELAGKFRHGRAAMQIHLALREPPRWSDPELGRVAVMHLVDGLDGVSRAVNEAERGLLPARGTIALGQPAALDPGRVPAGRGQLWIQILELPGRIKGDAAGQIAIPPDGRWTEVVREAYADRIVDRICAQLPGLRESILARRVLSPADLEHINVNLVGGDPYGGACSLDQMLVWRPLPGMGDFKTPVRGLFHIGASTHPGAGLGGGSGYALAARL
jgi:phytoene dehydrogenase-like protein